MLTFTSLIQEKKYCIRALANVLELGIVVCELEMESLDLLKYLVVGAEPTALSLYKKRLPSFLAKVFITSCGFRKRTIFRMNSFVTLLCLKVFFNHYLMLFILNDFRLKEKKMFQVKLLLICNKFVRWREIWLLIIL